MDEAILKQRMRTVLKVIEFADADYFVEIMTGIQNIVVQDELTVIYDAVIDILSVTPMVNTVQSRGCQTPFTYFPVTVNHYISDREDCNHEG